MAPDIGRETEIRPLTRTGADGVPHTRRESTLQQIRSLAVAEAAEIASRAMFPDTDPERYLKDEVLVYFFREWLKRIANGDGGAELEHHLSKLFDELERRFQSYLSRSRHRPPDRREFDAWAEAVNARFIEKLMDLDTDRIDFAEVGFLSFAALEALGQRRPVATESARRSLEISIDDDGPDDGTIQLAVNELPQDDRMLLKECLEKLPQELREVVLLIDLQDWRVESNDPDKPTVSKLLGVSGRTVRARHNRAKAMLEDILGGQR